ncbi:DUF5985 family protein [Planctomicrobium piriforme]|uniref:Uncharacterized protein n=1 Tax=Planctomicrobium piriforme TaxID=1576369 RepID=A0A1I3RXH9_9PLAN|nr:DUF5985 family protein [Planctomicrobium piriforme]SFJ51115.1 hypothetical protein SAMN05421753_12236 [Planctomicrobium piriforme]
MPGVVYLLSAAVSCLCAVLLFQGYRQHAVRLLLWSGLCFAGLTLDNLLLYVDQIVLPDVDLAILRRLPGLAGIVLLNVGLIWDSK